MDGSPVTILYAGINPFKIRFFVTTVSETVMNKSLKIVHFQLVPILSGVQNVMFHLLESLPKDKFEIYVMSQPGKNFETEVIMRGYNYIPLKSLRHPVHISDVFVFVQLVLLFRLHKFDIVHTHSSKPGLLGRIAARIAGVPLIIHTGHGAPFHFGQSKLAFRFFAELERFGAKFGDKLVFVNHHLREYYIAHHMVRQDKAITIYNALSPSLVSRLSLIATNRKEHNGLVTIGSILRFTLAKNIVKTVIAAIHVCQKRDDVRFIFIGDGEYFSLCRKLVVSNKLEEKIYMPGWLDDPIPQYGSFDAFLLYSIFEGLPMCVIEAMYSSLPIIGSDIPGIAELVDETNGWLIQSDNLLTFETSLHRIIDDKEHYIPKGKASYLKAVELCSYSGFINGYHALYYGETS